MDYIIRAAIGIIVAILLLTYLFPLFGFSGAILALAQIIVFVATLWYIFQGPSITGK